MSIVTVTVTPTMMVPLPTDSAWWSDYWLDRSRSEMAAAFYASTQSSSSTDPPPTDPPQAATAAPMIININIDGAETDIYQSSSSLLPSSPPPSPPPAANIVAPVALISAPISSYAFSPSPSPPPSSPPDLPPAPPPANSSAPIVMLDPQASNFTTSSSIGSSSSYQFIPTSSSSSIIPSISTPVYSPPPNTTSPPIYQYTPLTSNYSNTSTRTKTVMIVVTLSGTSSLGNTTTTRTPSQLVPNAFMNVAQKTTHTKLIVVTVTNSSMSPTGGLSTSTTTSSGLGIANFANYASYSPASSSSVSSSPLAAATWDPTSNKNIAVYFGQAPNTAGSSIQEQCEDPHISIVILSYVTEWDLNGSGYPQLNLGSNCPSQTHDQSQLAPGLWDCDRLVPQVMYCQSIGKKVLISIGGNSSGGATQFDNVSEAESRANLMWDLFGAGNLGPSGLNIRPFGNLSLDGFDVASVTPDTNYWSTFGTVLRNLYLTDKSKNYLLTASPQCVRPDPAIPMNYIQMTDIVIVQSYQDNDCAFGLPGWDKNLVGWAQDVGWHADGTYDLTVDNVAPPRVMIGAIAWNEDRQSGWINSSTPFLEENIAEVINMTGFGGICLWDGAQAQLAAVNQPTNYTEAAYLAMNGQLVTGQYASTVNSTGNSTDPPPSSSSNAPVASVSKNSVTDSTDIVSDAGTVSQVGTNKLRRRMYGMKKLYFGA
jgi:hypothetical protein